MLTVYLSRADIIFWNKLTSLARWNLTTNISEFAASLIASEVISMFTTPSNMTITLQWTSHSFQTLRGHLRTHGDSNINYYEIDKIIIMQFWRLNIAKLLSFLTRKYRINNTCQSDNRSIEKIWETNFWPINTKLYCRVLNNGRTMGYVFKANTH